MGVESMHTDSPCARGCVQFEQNMGAGNVTKLMEQLCWEIGFPDDAKLFPLYVTGIDWLIAWHSARAADSS